MSDDDKATLKATEHSLRQLADRLHTRKKVLGKRNRERLTPFRDELVGEWSNMLGHQVQTLPPVDSFWDALNEVLGWVGGAVERTQPDSLTLQPGEEILRRETMTPDK